ncbi:MAG: cysteine desulfurase [Candidatus Kapabacteria bacterium]|nr:cysteine desulfurase [Ignavibacteriota bacterium]MCW5885128.1 cysteine desulfurase [Candidatus Kapabacteria bacterium]
MFKVEEIRKDFPVLSRIVNGKPLVYLDNAATTQKPNRVIEAMDKYYREYNSNIHRGVHKLSQLSTNAYENARSVVKDYINADSIEEIIFTRGATESINLVAGTLGKRLKEGDEIIISHMEHHANIVPWQILREEKGIVLKVIPIDDNGDLILEEYEKLLSNRTKLVSVVHISNTLGTINPIEQIIAKAKEYNALTLIDASQSIHHSNINVRELDCDFLVFSGHKIYAPTGIGVLYGKRALLESLPPYQTGGDMIRTVSFEKTTFNDLPYKYEAGTPNIAGAIGLAEALNYIRSIGLDAIIDYENHLLDYGTKLLTEIPELRIIGTAKKKTAVISFVLEDIHPHDIGTMVDMDGIAIRTGQHCTEPLMRRFGVPATSRASFSFYNTTDEINVLHNSLINVIKMFK